MATIDQFKAQLIGGGARANQFRVILNTPPGIATGLPLGTSSFFIKAASLPGQTIPEITVNFRGRQLFLAGDRTFETWTTTILNDTDFAIRNGMERWMNGINGHTTNVGLVNPVDYQADLIVEQLDRDGSSIKRYDFRGAFPVNVGEIDLDYDTAGQIEQFQVVFAYQYWESNTTS